MSEQTAQKLQDTIAVAAARQAEADALKQQCLARVAHDMPDRVDEIAKRTAHNQPEITRQLGSDGIKTIRKEIADQVEAVAAELMTAADQIKWPTRQSEYSPIGPRNIHSALFTYLYGRRMDSIAAIFKRHGFAIHDDNAQRSQGLIYPQSLYNEDDFAAVAAGFNAVADAEKEVAAAKSDDDRDAVDALWAD